MLASIVMKYQGDKVPVYYGTKFIGELFQADSLTDIEPYVKKMLDSNNVQSLFIARAIIANKLVVIAHEK